MKSKSISWWFVPFYYPYTKSKPQSIKSVHDYLDKLKSNNEEPDFFHKLTPAKAIGASISGLGIISFLSGIFNQKTKMTFGGILTTIVGLIGFLSERFLMSNNNDEGSTPELINEERESIENTVKRKILIEEPVTTNTLEEQELSSIETKENSTISNKDEEKEIRFYSQIAFTKKDVPDDQKNEAIKKLLILGTRKSIDELTHYLNNENLEVVIWATVSLLNKNDHETALSPILNNISDQNIIDSLVECSKLDNEIFGDVPLNACKILKAAYSNGSNIHLLKALSRVPSEVYNKV